MTNPDSPPNVALVPRAYAPLPALLSYLVPGLGQIVQGRVAKGLLFLVCLYGLFFYGLYLGHWHSVYVPEAPPVRDGAAGGRGLDALTDRARFAGQFWIGVAAWPAILQYVNGTPYVEMPDGSRGKIVGSAGGEPRLWSPAQGTLAIRKRTESTVEVQFDEKWVTLPIHGLPLLGTFLRAPDESELNDELRNSDKTSELSWMYTVIAGVLNILVIYDAFAGPAFGAAAVKAQGTNQPEAETRKEPAVA